jgi:integrase/recombinase XerD
VFEREELVVADPSRVRVSGPLEPFASGFADALSRQGYRPVSSAFQLQLLAHLSRWLAGEGFDAGALTEARVEAFLAARRDAGYTNYLSSKALAPLLSFLRGIGVAPAPVVAVACTPVELVLAAYRRYLEVERGLAAVTIVAYLHMVKPFLAAHVDADGGGLERVSAADVSAFVLDECRSRSRGSAKLMVTALRSLLGFLHVEGLIGKSLTDAVPSIAGWRLARLPQRLEPGETAQLLAAPDRTTVVGRRDFAMLVLMVRLGLRRGEVAGLRLEGIDWRSGEIEVCGKGSRRERLPLPVDVGAALVEYLQRGRPADAEGRCVFIRVKAPHRGLTAAAISQVVIGASRKAGLGDVAAHRLRHTTAARMLAAGAPLTEISQVLRHRQLLTTAIYAKVDRDALRTLARPWPGGAS